MKGEACLADGDYESAAECFRESIEAAPEPWPSTHPRVYLGIAYMQLGRYEEAKPYLEQVIELSRERGSELTFTPSVALLGLAMCASGELTEGMRKIEESREWWSEHEAALRLGTMEVILGNVFLGLTESRENVGSPRSCATPASSYGTWPGRRRSPSSTSPRRFESGKASAR